MKTCPYCAEDIEARVRTCPYCGSNLKRPLAIKLEFVVGTLAIALGLWFFWGIYSRAAERSARHAGVNIWVMARAQWLSFERGEADLPQDRTDVIGGGGKPVICPLTKSPFEWRLQPPVGSRVSPLPVTDGSCLRFFACSSRPTWDGRRCFIFQEPGDVEVLYDSEVNWETQTMADCAPGK